MQINVVKNAKRNIIFSSLYRVIIMLCPFVERTLIRYVLGVEYLGLSGLFTSILTVLSLSELGFSSAVVYNLYKPIAEGDTGTVNAILRLYRKAYRIIGFVIMVIGLLLIPILPHLIKGTYPQNINITLLYLIYLVNTVISYWMFGYMNALATAHQRNDIEQLRNGVIKLLLTGCQIVVLISFKNYYYMILLLPVFTAMSNLWIGYSTHKAFPQYHCEGQLSKELLAEMKKLVAGTFVQRACSVTRNSLDSVCITAFMGLAMAGIYGNYYSVFYGVKIFISGISNAFIGGVGNHVAQKSVEENFAEMNKLEFMYMWIAGVATPCFLCLYQPFMTLWMGADMLVPMSVVVCFCVYFYLLMLGDIRSIYGIAVGIWWKMRYRAIAETILNLVLNIVLGKLFGLVGIISATMISLFFCNIIWGGIILFKAYFSMERIGQYYMNQVKQTIVNLMVCVVCYLACFFVSFGNHAITVLLRLVICIFVTNAVFWLIYRKTEKFSYLLNRVRRKNA